MSQLAQRVGELALFDQHHGRDQNDRLCHGIDAKDCIRFLSGPAFPVILKAERFSPKYATLPWRAIKTTAPAIFLLSTSALKASPSRFSRGADKPTNQVEQHLAADPRPPKMTWKTR